MLKRLFIFLFAFGYLTCEILTAQEPYVLHEGDIVRIKYQCKEGSLVANEESREGSVIALKDNFLHLILLESEDHRVVPWNCMKKWWIAEVRTTKSKSGGQGFLIGSLVGTGVGFVTGGALGKSSFFGEDTSGLIGAAGGFLIGGIAGVLAVKPKYKWRRMKNQQILLGPKVTGGTVGVGLTLVL